MRGAIAKTVYGEGAGAFGGGEGAGPVLPSGESPGEPLGGGFGELLADGFGEPLGDGPAPGMPASLGR